MVSEIWIKHGGFIVNKGRYSQEDDCRLFSGYLQPLIMSNPSSFPSFLLQPAFFMLQPACLMF